MPQSLPLHNHLSDENLIRYVRKHLPDLLEVDNEESETSAINQLSILNGLKRSIMSKRYQQCGSGPSGELIVEDKALVFWMKNILPELLGPAPVDPELATVVVGNAPQSYPNYNNTFFDKVLSHPYHKDDGDSSDLHTYSLRSIKAGKNYSEVARAIKEQEDVRTYAELLETDPMKVVIDTEVRNHVSG